MAVFIVALELALPGTYVRGQMEKSMDDTNACNAIAYASSILDQNSCARDQQDNTLTTVLWISCFCLCSVGDNQYCDALSYNTVRNILGKTNLLNDGRDIKGWIFSRSRSRLSYGRISILAPNSPLLNGQAGRQADRQAGRQAGGQAGRHQLRECFNTCITTLNYGRYVELPKVTVIRKLYSRYR